MEEEGSEKLYVCSECGYEGSEDDICPDCGSQMLPKEKSEGEFLGGDMEAEEEEERI